LSRTTLPVADTRATWRAALGLLRSEKRAVFTSVLFYAMATTASLAPAWMVGGLVDSLPGAGRDTVIAVMIVLFALLIAQTGLVVLCRIIVVRLSERIMCRLREGFVRDTLWLPPSRLSGGDTGELMTRSTDDVAVLNNALRNAAPEVLLASVTMLVVGIGLVFTSPLMSLACLVAVPLVGLPARWALRRVRSRQLAERAAYGAIADSLASTVRGARTVEAFGLEEVRVRRVEADLEEVRTAALRSLRLRQVLFPAIDGGMAAVLACGLALGGLLHAAGLVTPGEVATCLLLIRQLSEPVATLTIWLQRFLVGGASLSRVLGVAGVSEPDTRPAQEAGRPSTSSSTGASPDSPAVELRAIEHSYGRAPVLRGVDLSVRRGEFLAVVGPSGSGKTTLGRLLCASERTRTGEVLVHGTPVTELSLEERRRRVLMVSQEQHVFQATVADNLRMAGAAATKDDLLDALSRTGALDWALSLEQGIDTVVGGRDRSVPPEMAQRLALARALLAAPEVLILDEATSVLTPAAAQRLEDAVVRALPGRTIIAVAHQLHTAHRADRVVVLRDGLITETGHHRDLVRGGGVYQRLWKDHLV
jgi:ABC-type multidrug transport system fused ATPase/permease subunit